MVMPRQSTHLILLLPALIFVTSYSLSTTSENLNKNLRRTTLSARILERDVGLQCPSSNCHEKGLLSDSQMVYHISLGPQSSLTIEFDLQNQNKLDVDFAFGSYNEIQAAIEIFAPDPANAGISLHTSSDWQTSIPINLTSFSSKKFTITIMSPYSSPSDINFKITKPGKSAWIVPVAAASGALLAIILVVLYLYYGWGILCFDYYSNSKRHNFDEANSPPETPTRFDASESEKLAKAPSVESQIDSRFPETKFVDLKDSFAQKTCSICLEDLEGSQLCRQLYCEHIFHSGCMKLWLENQLKTKIKAFCPNCNEEIMRVDNKHKG